MYQFITVIHILLGIGIVGLVLMQHGKGADAGAAFGSGASGSVFGAQGAASFLSRTTAIFATLFFLTSLGLAILSGNQVQKSDLMDTVSDQAQPNTANADSAVPTVESKIPAELPIKEIEKSAK